MATDSEVEGSIRAERRKWREKNKVLKLQFRERAFITKSVLFELRSDHRMTSFKRGKI